MCLTITPCSAHPSLAACSENRSPSPRRRSTASAAVASGHNPTSVPGTANNCGEGRAWALTTKTRECYSFCCPSDANLSTSNALFAACFHSIEPCTAGLPGDDPNV